jgi:hypothetical protein
MCLRYGGRVKEVNRLDLDLHSDACVVGKEALIFQDFDREVTVIGYDSNGETKFLKMVSAVSEALGYIIPGTGRTIVLIIHQDIFLPQLEHNLLSTMQIRLHDVVINDTPKL